MERKWLVDSGYRWGEVLILTSMRQGPKSIGLVNELDTSANDADWRAMIFTM
jgi:hypothetical protein